MLSPKRNRRHARNGKKKTFIFHCHCCRLCSAARRGQTCVQRICLANQSVGGLLWFMMPMFKIVRQFSFPFKTVLFVDFECFSFRNFSLTRHCLSSYIFHDFCLLFDARFHVRYSLSMYSVVGNSTHFTAKGTRCIFDYQMEANKWNDFPCIEIDKWWRTPHIYPFLCQFGQWFIIYFRPLDLLGA